MINNLENEKKEIENNMLQNKTSTEKEFYNKDDDFLPEDNLELIKKILEDFMGLGCHFGHPKISPKAKKAEYVLYKLNGCNIVNLDKTIENLRNALKLIFNTVNKGEKILFLTTNENLKNLFKEIALQCRAFFITVRYQPGTLTNSNHFFDKKRRLDSTKSTIDDSLTKKEKKVLKNKIQNTEDYFEGLVGYEVPKLIITIGGEKEYNSVIDEAQKMGIGIISLNDVNVEPVSGFNTITVPVNTKSVETIRYILNLMSKVILSGYEEYISYNNKRMFKGELPNASTPTPKVTMKDLEEKMKEKILSKVSKNIKEKKIEEKTTEEN